MHKLMFVVSGCVFFFVSCGQQTSPDTLYTPVETTSVFRIGNREITLLKQQYGERDDFVMLNLHDNERTSVNAAEKILEKKGGTIIRILNDSARLISFSLGNRDYSFDPNRIFTHSGARESLQKRSNMVTPEAINATRKFADFILNFIPKGNILVIALHNNDEGRLRIDSYLKGGEFVRDAALASKVETRDADNFYFTTERKLYDKLKERYNVVLQDNKKVTDDGSLSVYCGKKNKRYINVEVQHGNEEEQVEMLLEIIR
jgi:hypothetical protein